MRGIKVLLSALVECSNSVDQWGHIKEDMPVCQGSLQVFLPSCRLWAKGFAPSLQKIVGVHGGTPGNPIVPCFQ